MENMYRFPLSIPEGRSLKITQPFKSTQLLDFYKSKGLAWSAHDAIDVARETDAETYGTPFVCPFPTATLDRITHGNAETGEQGVVQIKYFDGKDTLVLGGVHLSGTVEQSTYKEGDILGYIGNYGWVLPEPTIAKPFAGSHIHLYLIKNGVFINPLEYFDISKPFRSADTGWARDILAIKWAKRKIHDWMARLGISA